MTMRRIVLLLLLLSSAMVLGHPLDTAWATVTWQEPNYDESKVAPYALEDPLTFLDGRKVTAENWSERRREILGIFAKEMYGAEPPAPETVVTEVREKGVTLGEMAVREQVRMWFRPDRTGPHIDWLIVRPRYAKGPVPVIAMLNYYGNHAYLDDEEVFVPEPASWMQNEQLSAGGNAITNHQAHAGYRGFRRLSGNRSICPVEMLLARGYAFVTACYADVSPDPDWKRDDMEKLPYTGIFELWGTRDPARTDNTTALGAWAWALSRAVDYAEKAPELDAKRVVVTGCSRLGKAALIAAARDERFAVCVPNQTGGGGVPLAKRNYGENVATEMVQFPHWYCKAYAKYADDPAKTLTFDQHLLLACVAPRPLLVEGYDGRWFDPKGEFLSVQAASSVWKLLAGEPTAFAAMPDDFDESAIGRDLGYVRRPGRHGYTYYDWRWLLDFADRHVRRGSADRTKVALIAEGSQHGAGRDFVRKVD